MLQNIIDNLKNQGIEPDLAQSNLIEELKIPLQKIIRLLIKLKKINHHSKVFMFGAMLEGVKQ